MSGNWKIFIQELSKIKHKRSLALLLYIFIGSLSLSLSGLLVYGVFDWLLALPQMFRLVLSLIFALGIVLFFFVRIIKVLNSSRDYTARLIDKAMRNKRSEILSAYELGNSTDRDGIRGFFIEQVINEALKKMEILSWNKYYPKRKTFRSLRILLTVLVLSCLLYVIFPVASSVIFKRIVSPLEDIPPFSPYVFKISPANPKVIYGGKLELTAEISGAEINSQVLFVTRSATGTIHATPCFKLDKNKFAQKVERVNNSIYFCFKTGRARSHWKKISLLLQPRISMVKIKVQAPAYSMLPDKNFFSGIDILKDLKGSKVELIITSNRPLKSGYLKLIPEDMEKGQTIQGTKNSSHSICFKWTLKEAAELKFYIEDILGTECQKALKIKQYIQKDELPQIMVQEPVGFIMATPDSIIDFSITAEDDLGIKQIDIIRNISGFRDRIKAVQEGYEGKDYAYDGKLDLKLLGTAPGQELEFYFEAFDYNPELSGVASSELVKIKLISKGEYARLLRMKSSILELETRYNLIGRKLFKFRTSLDQFVKELKKGKLSTKDKAKYIKKLQKDFFAAQKIIRKFAKDFAIYDIEKKHQKVINKILRKMEKSTKTVKSLNPGSSNKILLDKLNNILATAEQCAKANQDIRKDAKLLSLLELLFEETTKFKELVGEQRMLVKRLSVYKTNSSAERLARLPGYSSKEAELLAEYMSILKKLKNIAFKLPISEHDLSTHIERFIEIARELKIKALLQKTIDYAKFKNGDRAHHFASLALEKMLELLQNKKNQISALCRGNIPSCLSDELQKTASQMLNSLLNKRGQGKSGKGKSAGMGGGNINDGFFGEGASALNIPLIGPNRHSPGSKSSSSGRGGHEGKNTYGRAFRGENINRENMNISKRTRTRTESINLDRVPWKYRKAVKKYFGGKK